MRQTESRLGICYGTLADDVAAYYSEDARLDGMVIQAVTRAKAKTLPAVSLNRLAMLRKKCDIERRMRITGSSPQHPLLG